jgi:hypothetical protein
VDAEDLCRHLDLGELVAGREVQQHVRACRMM